MSILRLSYFRHILVPHWLASQPCAGCGQVEREVNVTKVLLFNEQAGQILLSLPHQCQCGRQGCAQVTMSILVFGYLLYQAVKLDLSKNRRRRGVSVRAQKYDGLPEMLSSEFEAVKAQARHPGRANSSSPISQSETDEFLKLLDDVEFKPGSETWISFLRELGINPNSSTEGS